MKLYLWKLEQSENNTWDTWDSCVVVSEFEEKAKRIHPNFTTSIEFREDLNGWVYFYYDNLDREVVKPWVGDWASSPNKVKATLIGEAADFLKEGSVICASYNAG